MQFWWVVASENNTTGGWHWDEFFNNPKQSGKVYSWGGSDWIRSPYSHSRIRKMRKGDIVAAHQGGEGILGLIYLANNGDCSNYEEQYDCFDLKTSPIIRFKNPISFHLIKDLPNAVEHFEFVKFHQSTVFQITEEGFNMLITLAAELNPNQIKELESFLRKGKLETAVHHPDDISATSNDKIPQRIETKVTRIIRDSAKTKKLKLKYEYRCQLCDETVRITADKFYAEVHHIRPLGGNHKGLDNEENMIVVCPTHHAYFDLGVPLFISDNEIQIGEKTFTLTSKHLIDASNIEYHNKEIFGCNL